MIKFLSSNLPLILAIFANFISVIALIMNYRVAKSNNLRVRRQVTIESYNSLFDLHKKSLDIIRQYSLSKDELPKQEIFSNPDLREAVRDYLKMMERFSVGINEGVYDLEIFNKMAGSNTITNYNRLRSYIDDVRNKGRESYYIEFELLVSNLISYRNRWTKEHLNYKKNPFLK